MLRSTDLGKMADTSTMRRVPGHDEATMAYALDAGASIAVPHVDTAEQAKEIVRAVKFGKKHRGIRSAPPFRYTQGLTDMPMEPEIGFWESLNNQSALLIQIETLEGIHNLDSILTEAPDIDVVWLGALDARVSMGLPAGFGVQATEPEWLEAVELFQKTLRKHNKPYSGFCFAKGEELRKATSNMAMCVITSDTTKLAEMMGELGGAKETLVK